MMSQNKLYEVALSQIDNVGDITIRHLISYCGSAEAVFKAPKSKITAIPGIGEVVYNSLQDKLSLTKAELIISKSEKANAKILHYLDADYPKRLKNIYDAPAILYLKGNCDLNFDKSLGIVGTRRASDYGKSIADKIVEDLIEFNPFIISGLAYGIDIAAHKAALKFNVPTIAVLAGGLDKIYPKEHFKYLEKIEENGAILSERPFGDEPIRSGFLARNRIIAGLSDAVVVVESAAKGGAMVTAEYANNYHKEVFAVPGNIGISSSEGCNALIDKNKARIFTKSLNIVEALNWDLTTETKTNYSKEIDLSNFTDEETLVISMLRDNGEMLIDDLSWKSQLSMNKLASILLNLEFQSIVKPLPGKKFKLA
jgi:DNA processing protein